MIPRRTAKEISDALISQLETELQITIPSMFKKFYRVLSKAIGGISVLNYEHSMWVLKQLFVKSADNTPVTIHNRTLTPLQEHGKLVGIYQDLGVRAEHTIAITVITQTGSISSGERVIDADTQLIYTVIGDVALSAATVYATIRATSSGEIGNVDVGTTLYFVSPPSTVEKAVSVTANLVTGTDPETTEAFRERILTRWMARPQGGSYADYKLWAESYPGVLNAYPYSGWGDDAIPDSAAGQVFIYLESEGDPDGIPESAFLALVREYIEGTDTGLATRRNINAYIQMLPISRTAFDVTITGLATSDNANAKTAIESALFDYFLSCYPGGQVGYTVRPPRKDIITKMEIGGIISRVAAGYSGIIGDITITVGVTDYETYPLQEGEKAKLGTVTWL